jgi:hypothetical protein
MESKSFCLDGELFVATFWLQALGHACPHRARAQRTARKFAVLRANGAGFSTILGKFMAQELKMNYLPKLSLEFLFAAFECLRLADRSAYV